MTSTSVLTLGLALFIGACAALPATAATATPAPAKPAATAPAPSKSVLHKKTFYYVSLREKGHGCEIVTSRPELKMMIGKHLFTTEAAAKKAMASAKACHA